MHHLKEKEKRREREREGFRNNKELFVGVAVILKHFSSTYFLTTTTTTSNSNNNNVTSNKHNKLSFIIKISLSLYYFHFYSLNVYFIKYV